MFLLIDNYDSFTFNLVQYFQQLGKGPLVLKNDDERILELAKSDGLEMVCISPGPSTPKNAGLCLEFLKILPTTIPVLGVCLGHQTLAEFAGAEVKVNYRIMHGKVSKVFHNGTDVFTGMDNPFNACRYHSLVVDMDGVDVLEKTAWTEEGEIMGLRYTDRPWVGVQFHPESILTEDGLKMLGNFPDKLK